MMCPRRTKREDMTKAEQMLANVLSMLCSRKFDRSYSSTADTSCVVGE